MFPSLSSGTWAIAIYVRERGSKHRDAEVLTGFAGAGVLEVVADFRGDTFRVVYTLKDRTASMSSHAFHKKSKAGAQRRAETWRLLEQRLLPTA